MIAIRERRGMKRRPCNAEVDLSFFNRESRWEGCLLNITPKGAYLETTRPLTQKSAVLVRVLSCEDPGPDYANGLCSNAVAEVKWCRKLTRAGKADYGVGLEYYFSG